MSTMEISPEATYKMTEKEREEIIAYGLERTKVILVSVMVTLLLGSLFDILIQSVAFFVVFTMLRRFAGGYHADTQNRCYVISFFILVISFLCIKYGYLNHILFQAMSLLIILLLAPVENANHKLEECEKKRYGRKTKLRAIGLFLLSCILWYQKLYFWTTPIVIANLVVVFSLVAGCIKNYYQEKTERETMTNGKILY